VASTHAKKVRHDPESSRGANQGGKGGPSRPAVSRGKQEMGFYTEKRNSRPKHAVSKEGREAQIDIGGRFPPGSGGKAYHGGQEKVKEELLLRHGPPGQERKRPGGGEREDQMPSWFVVRQPGYSATGTRRKKRDIFLPSVGKEKKEISADSTSPKREPKKAGTRPNCRTRGGSYFAAIRGSRNRTSLEGEGGSTGARRGARDHPRMICPCSVANLSLPSGDKRKKKEKVD